MSNRVGALIYVSLLTYGVNALGWHWQKLQAPIDHADDLLTAALVLALVMVWLRGRRRARA